MPEDAALQRKSGSDIRQTEDIRAGWHYRPLVDIVESDDELTLFVDMPGIASDGIDIHYEHGTLMLNGRVEPRQPQEMRYLLREYGVGGFHRTFQIDETIDNDRITADYSQGVLTVHLPKSEAVKPRKIKVQQK